MDALRKASDKVASARGYTVIVDGIETKITDARRRLADLGQVPEAGDTAAALIGDIGHVGESKVSKSLLLLYALVVEGMAFIGPAATLYAAGIQSHSQVTKTETSPPATSRQPVETEQLPVPTPRKSRKRTETGTETDVSHVERWIKARTLQTPGGLIQCSLALEDYERWRRLEKAKAPVLNLTTFGNAMKALGVTKEKKNGRFHYAGLSLAPALKVVC